MVVKEEDVEKRIGGCMAGFFNIFDRPHLLSPKRFSLPKRLSSSSSLKTEPSSLDSGNQSVYSTPQLRSPAPAPREHFKQQVVSSKRFSKEAPRLSLDSRAVVDAKGSLKARQIHTDGGSGSPSVIARLMGLEALSDSQPLQRSASESRVINRFVDSLNFQNPQSTQGVEDHHEPSRARGSSTPVPLRRKSFFDTADFFPEPKQMTTSRGSSSDSDLETLKQLLEALRLKGLLHSKRNVIPQSPIRSLTSKRDLSKGKTSENSVKTPNRRPTTLKDSWRAEHVHIEDEHEEFNRHGKTLLERCDKLLHSIAKMEEAAGDSQPSPVSVLDAAYEDSSPSPVMKRTLPFTVGGDTDEMLQLTWSEFHKLRKKSSPPAEEADLVGYVCGVLQRDLSEDPWRDFQVEMSEAVLVIERLLFKDLIGETIRHMAALNRSPSLRRRRRLLF